MVPPLQMRPDPMTRYIDLDLVQGPLLGGNIFQGSFPHSQKKSCLDIFRFHQRNVYFCILLWPENEIV